MNKNYGKGEVLKNLLGLNIRRFRVISGYTMEKLADKSCISVTFLAAIERGEKWPSPSTLAAIAQGLEVNAYDLFKPEEPTSQDIKKITTKLISDITKIVNQSVKMMNTIAKDHNKSEK